MSSLLSASSRRAFLRQTALIVLLAQMGSYVPARAARIGERIRARTGSTTRDGIFETIDASGALVLNMSGMRVAIPAAEVFF